MKPNLVVTLLGLGFLAVSCSRPNPSVLSGDVGHEQSGRTGTPAQMTDMDCEELVSSEDAKTGDIDNFRHWAQGFHKGYVISTIHFTHLNESAQAIDPELIISNTLETCRNGHLSTANASFIFSDLYKEQFRNENGTAADQTVSNEPKLHAMTCEQLHRSYDGDLPNERAHRIRRLKTWANGFDAGHTNARTTATIEDYTKSIGSWPLGTSRIKRILLGGTSVNINKILKNLRRECRSVPEALIVPQFGRIYEDARWSGSRVSLLQNYLAGKYYQQENGLLRTTSSNPLNGKEEVAIFFDSLKQYERFVEAIHSDKALVVDSGDDSLWLGLKGTGRGAPVRVIIRFQ